MADGHPLKGLGRRPPANADGDADGDAGVKVDIDGARSRRPARGPALLRSDGARRARWGIVDQGLSSVTNFGVTAAAAHYSDPERFGAFSFGFAVYILSLWVARSLVAEPYVVRLTQADPDARRQEGAKALGTSAVLGVVGMAVMAVLALVLGPPSRSVLIVMGLGLPALLLQDTYRYVLIASGRTGAAAVNDGLWLALQCVFVAVLVAVHHPDAVWVAAGFGLGAAAACVAGRFQTGLAPRPAAAWDWLRRYRDLGAPFLYELVVINGVTQLTILAIGIADHVVVVGQLRAGLLLFAPPTVIFAGIFLVGLPEAVRLASSPPTVSRLVVVMGLVTSLATVVWAAALVVVPDSLGEAVLGVNWAPGRRLLVPVGLLTMAAAWMLAVSVGLRALGAARRTLPTRSYGAPVIFVLGLAGALVDGSVAAAAGLAVGGWVCAALAWTAFRRVLAEPVPSTPAEPGLVP